MGTVIGGWLSLAALCTAHSAMRQLSNKSLRCDDSA